jgi:pyruvate kinase
MNVCRLNFSHGDHKVSVCRTDCIDTRHVH